MELNENNTGENRLEELGGSDYEIVDGEHNIKGWVVKNERGEKIGEVDELLFDPASRSVRYLVVDLDDNELELENDDRKVLIPIGLAELHGSDEDIDGTGEGADSSIDETSPANSGESDFAATEHEFDKENDVVKDGDITGDDERIDLEDRPSPYDPYDDGDVVIIPNVTAAQLNALPAYEKDQVSPELESEIRNIFEGSGAVATVIPGSDFYDHDHFNENRFYNAGNNEETGSGSRLAQRPVSESGQAFQAGEKELDQRNDISFSEGASEIKPGDDETGLGKL